MSDKLQRQLDLEEEGVTLGIKKYRDSLTKEAFSDLPAGVALLKRAVEPTAKAVEAFLTNNSVGAWAGKKALIRKFLITCDVDEVAYITAKACINAITHNYTLQKTAITLASMVKDNVEYRKFKGDKQLAYLRAVERNIKSSNEQYKRTVIMHAKRKIGIGDTVWTEADKLQIGSKLIELFIQATGLVEIHNAAVGCTRLKAVAKTEQWLNETHARCELLHPVFLPMIVKPVEWTSVYGGGFLSANLSTPLIKTRNKEAVAALEKVDMPDVFAAINAVQNTAWRINSKVYEVMKSSWDSGLFLGLPNANGGELPAKPWASDAEYDRLKAETPAVVAAWKRAASIVYDRTAREKSKRLAVIQKLWIADKFKDEEEIFFCWTMDWRGRLYPVQSMVNPQADDTGKALLEFAEGKPLGERGVYWLKVHLANEYGYDKVTFDERVEWVESNEAFILDSAHNALDGERFWTEADNPYRFLAACLEYAGYKAEGNSYVSHLPIGLDGSCNGLQNFSAMLLDEVGGAAVNLIPTDKPADVYSDVAKVVSAMVEADAAVGNEMAQVWVGKIDRGITKRNVMTVPYGAKKYGMKNQLLEELAKRDTPTEKYLTAEDNFHPSVYLSNVMYDGIGQVVIAARKAMDWLQDVAKVCSKAEQPIQWITPVGLQVQQLYKKQKLKQIDTFWGGVRLRLQLTADTDTLNKNKMASSISPNFVHSMDASHLMKTVNSCVGVGMKSFSMVHDSYGVHAGDVDTLACNLREAFIEQYKGDVLQKFRDTVIEQLPSALAEEIPALPTKGTLDLDGVRDSRYFFA